MEKKNIIIVILSILVVGLSSYIVYDKVFSDNDKDDKKLSNNQVDIIDNGDTIDQEQQNSDVKSYKEYKATDEIKLKDGSIWMVLENSDNTKDYITVLSTKEYEVGNDDWQILFDEFYNRKDEWTFSESQVYNYLKKIKNTIPVNFKEIDGYEIRLIKIEEIINLDSSWKYDELYDSYNYTGDVNKINKNLNGIATMDKTKCGYGKCAQYYVSGFNSTLNEYFISTWSSSIGNFKPVINIYKDSIIEN